MLIATVWNILYPTKIKWQNSSSDDIMVNDLSGDILHSYSVLKQEGTLGRTFEWLVCLYRGLQSKVNDLEHPRSSINALKWIT